VDLRSADDGHLQATGRDARQRKQYRYHQRWREVRDETKYGRLIPFAGALPRIRRRVARDLARPGLPRAKVLATVVRLLETTRARIGNEEYVRANESFGLTTLRERQVRVRGSNLTFAFAARRRRARDQLDRRLAGIVRRMWTCRRRALPSCRRRRRNAAHRVRRRECPLKEVSGGDSGISAPGPARCSPPARCTRSGLAPPGRRQAQHRSGIAAVAGALGNTRAVCRKFIHPEISSTAEGELGIWQREAGARALEKAVAALLKARTRRAAAATGAAATKAEACSRRSARCSRTGHAHYSAPLNQWREEHHETSHPCDRASCGLERRVRSNAVSDCCSPSRLLRSRCSTTNRLSYAQRLLHAAEIRPHQGVVFLQGPAPLEQVRVANQPRLNRRCFIVVIVFIAALAD
jgi:DNA topoisomerase-1